MCNIKNFEKSMAMLFEADTNSEVLFAKLFQTKDEEFRIYKQIVSFENGLIKKGYQR